MNEKNWAPPCMNSKIKTSYPGCKPRPRADNKDKCSPFVAVGCHGFYPSSDAGKQEAANGK